MIVATFVPVVPRPFELKIAQMIGEPGGEPFDAHGLHGADTIEQELGGLGEHERNVVGLEFAQFDEYGAVEDFDVRRLGQLKQLSEQALDDHVMQRQLVTGCRAQNCRLLEKLVGT